MKRVLPFLLLALCLAGSALAANSRPGEGLADLARSFQRLDGHTAFMADEAEHFLDGPDAGWSVFSGHVAIRHKGLELRADTIRYNAETGDAEALGNVALIGDKDELLWKGDELKINLRERAGRAENVDLYTRPFRVLAADAAFVVPTRTNQVFEISNATLTTCTNDPGHFHYYLTARRARFRPDDDVTAWGVVPHFFGVPVFYFPYYWKDLSRHYGFRFVPGYRHSWGPFLLSTYKFPIHRDRERNEYVDSHTYADWRGERGWAFGEQFSWEFGHDESSGYLTGYYMPKDNDPPDEIDPDQDDRYRIRLSHSWNATDRDQVLLHGLYVSDERVQKDFFRKEYKEMSEPDNYATYTHYGEDFSAGLTARARLNDFYSQVERLPEAWFTLNSQDLGGTGLYLDNESSLAYLRRRYKETSNLKDFEAFRADTDFLLSYPAKFFGFLSVVPRTGWRGTFYDKTREIESVPRMVTTVSTNLFGDVYSTVERKTVTVVREKDADFRSLFEFGAEVSTRAYGFWDEPDGARWRHVVEPYLNWTYVPEPNLRPTQLWQFDAIDRLDKRNTVRFGLRQRWQMRPPELSPQEIFYVDVWTDVNLEPEEEENSISDAGWNVRYHPTDWMQFQVKGLYDNDESVVDNAEFVLTAWHKVFRCDVEYRYRDDNNSLFSGYVTWYPNEHWGFDLFGRYEFETDQVEEVGGWLQYSWDCFALRLVGSIEPGYDREDGTREEDDWSISLIGWLTDFVPDSILEEDKR